MQASSYWLDSGQYVYLVLPELCGVSVIKS